MVKKQLNNLFSSLIRIPAYSIEEKLDSENLDNEIQKESSYPLISVQDADFKKYSKN